MAKKLGTLKVKRFFLGTDSGKRGTEVTSSAAELNQLGEGSITSNLTGHVKAANGNNLLVSGATTAASSLTAGTVTASTSSNLADVTCKSITLQHPTDLGGLVVEKEHANASITAAASITIPVAIPAGAVILGCQLRVDVALTAGETWDAAYEGGSTQAIASAQAVALNTKVEKMYDANGATAIAASETDIAITKNGGGSFTALGEITAQVFYMTTNPLPDAS